MTDLPPVDTIIEDIEFELLLGATPAGDVGQALIEIRREQNRIRREYARKRVRVDARGIVGALLRVNDMLLDLLHDMLLRLARVESVVERAARRLSAPPVDEGQAGCRETMAREKADAWEGMPASVPDLRLDVDLDVQPLPLPIVGRLIDRLRLALHKLSVYYVRRLAQWQGAVNVYYAGEVSRLGQIVSEQQRRLAALEQEVINLRNLVPTNHTEEGLGVESD